MVRVMCLWMALFGVNIAARVTDDFGIGMVVGLPIGLLLAAALYVYFVQGEQGARGEFWLDLPPSVAGPVAADRVVALACKASGVGQTADHQSPSGGPWKPAPGLTIKRSETTWGKPNILRLSYGTSVNPDEARALKGAVLEGLGRPWIAGDGADGPETDPTSRVVDGPEWAKAITRQGSETTWDIGLPSENPADAAPGWWASYARRPTLASLRTHNARDVARLCLAMGVPAVLIGLFVGPKSSSGIGLIVGGVLLVVIMAVVMLAAEAQEARAWRRSTRSNARCYLRVEPGTNAPSDVVGAIHAAVRGPWPWVRRVAAPRGALAYWSDSDEESQAVLWTGAGVGLPVLELRSARPAAEVARLKGEILDALYPDG